MERFPETRLWITRVWERINDISFPHFRSLLRSKLFDVNTTVPWGLYLVGAFLKASHGWTRRKDGTINRRLGALLEIKVSTTPMPVRKVSSEDVLINAETRVWVRIFTPHQGKSHHDSARKCSLLVYFHGGGFGVLSADSFIYDRFCRAIGKTCNVVVVSVNYRLAPEHRYPTAYDDSFEVLEWLQSSDSIGHLPSMADVSQCFLAGDSAGGNIVHFMGCRAAERDLSPLQIRGMILLQPYLGSEQRTPAELMLVNVPIISVEATDWHWKAFLPVGADRDHPACNIFGANAPNISKLSLPPMFVITGSLDLLKDHQARYALQIQEMGKVIKVKHYLGGIHGFYFFPGTKLTLACIADVKEFVQSCLDVID